MYTVQVLKKFFKGERKKGDFFFFCFLKDVSPKSLVFDALPMKEYCREGKKGLWEALNLENHAHLSKKLVYYFDRGI